jgi:hypothetical protein
MAPTTNANIALHERIAVLETNAIATTQKLNEIGQQLDSLLELKAKGMGALGLVSLVVGSGLLGIIGLLINYFRGGGTHL